MTKLVSEIKEAIDKVSIFDEQTEGLLPNIHEALAKAAAEVAKRYIEKAFDAGTRMGMDEFNPDKKTYLESEGITEQPGIVVSNGLTSTE